MEKSYRMENTKETPMGEGEAGELPSDQRGQLVAGTQMSQGLLLPKVPGGRGRTRAVDPVQGHCLSSEQRNAKAGST